MEWLDPKTKLNQLCALKSPSANWGTIPQYLVAELAVSQGRFTVSVNFNDEHLGTGDGLSIKEAEVNAARDALKNEECRIIDSSLF